MDLYPIEVTNGANWGKFAVGRFTDEHRWESALPGNEGRPLLRDCGWNHENPLWVMDLQTREAAVFMPPGHAPADLAKHAIWVCVLFEDFLGWLYQQDLSDLSKLPRYVELPEAPGGLYGYRRPGLDRQAAAGGER